MVGKLPLAVMTYFNAHKCTSPEGVQQLDRRAADNIVIDDKSSLDVEVLSTSSAISTLLQTQYRTSLFTSRVSDRL